MKNKLIILILLCLFWSCSSDDDNNRAYANFIGDWFVYSIVINGQEQNLNNCDRENVFYIYDDGTFEEVGIFTDINGNCQTDYVDFGVWDSLGNDRYALIYDPDFNGFIFEVIVRVENESFSITYDDFSVWSYGKE
ncbi:MAG: hypothetical protein HRU49_12660 [Winogradskyella sp.]|uniref:hypothetical protein n=1 Tax=Winogradskyella sp. TaxID=1883156 RepID=UPI0025CDF683|nr:hypothetical protein [Winogradskyella sp.]NRB84601.1 hypothetical protein [Winogradskyella sp.]